MAEDKASAAYRVEALARGLRILALFSSERPVQRLKDLAENARLPLPTAFRLVSTLEELNYLKRTRDGNWTPGLAVLDLGYAALRSDSPAEAAAEPLRQLSEEGQCTTNLGVLHGDEVLYVVRFRHEEGLYAANVQVGSTLPAVCSSIGKVILAFQSPAELRSHILPGTFTRAMGPNAVRSMAELKRRLAVIREQGWSPQDEETARGMRAIAAPVRNSSGKVIAGVSVAVTADLLIEDIIKRFKEPILATAAEISGRLGYAPAAEARVTDAS